MIDITFLGTAGSAPTKERALPAVAIEYDGNVFLFDCSEGTQRQLMEYSINPFKIKAIFITHLHGDHVIGVAGLVRTLALLNRVEPLYIYVPEGEEKKVNLLITFDNALINYKVVIKGIRTGTIFKGKTFMINAFRLEHSIKTYGFLFKENDKLHFIKEKSLALGLKGEMFSKFSKTGTMLINGKRIKLKDVTTIEKGKKIVYATDTRPTKNTVLTSANADLLIHEATYSDVLKDLAVQRKHSTAKEAATVAKKAKVKILILFHLSSRYADAEPLLKEAKSVFKDTSIAYDGLKLSI